MYSLPNAKSFKRLQEKLDRDENWIPSPYDLSLPLLVKFENGNQELMDYANLLIGCNNHLVSTDEFWYFTIGAWLYLEEIKADTLTFMNGNSIWRPGAERFLNMDEEEYKWKGKMKKIEELISNFVHTAKARNDTAVISLQMQQVIAYPSNHDESFQMSGHIESYQDPELVLRQAEGFDLPDVSSTYLENTSTYYDQIPYLSEGADHSGLVQPHVFIAPEYQIHPNWGFPGNVNLIRHNPIPVYGWPHPELLSESQFHQFQHNMQAIPDPNSAPNFANWCPQQIFPSFGNFGPPLPIMGPPPENFNPEGRQCPIPAPFYPYHGPCRDKENEPALFSELGVVTNRSQNSSEIFYTNPTRTLRQSSEFEPARLQEMCSFCVSQNRAEEFCRSHLIYFGGICHCPLLRQHICGICGATGDFAHMIHECPVYPGRPVTNRRTEPRRLFRRAPFRRISQPQAWRSARTFRNEYPSTRTMRRKRVRKAFYHPRSAIFRARVPTFSPDIGNNNASAGPESEAPFY